MTPIVLAAQKGCADSKEEIVRRFTPAAKVAAKRLLKWLPFEEAISVAYEGLTEAINGFRPKRHAQFSTFAVVCMRNAVTRHIQRRVYAPSLVQSIPVGLDVDGGSVDKTLTVTHVELMRVASTALFDTQEKAIFEMLCQECEQKEIADRLGIKRYALVSIMESVRAKARIALWGSGYGSECC